MRGVGVRVKDTEFEICHGDTLTNDWDILRELNPASKPEFDAIVAKPWLMNAPAFTLRAACWQVAPVCFEESMRGYLPSAISTAFRFRSGCRAPPGSAYRWNPTDAMGDGVRFKNYGLAPKSAADFAFLAARLPFSERRSRAPPRAHAGLDQRWRSIAYVRVVFTPTAQGPKG